MIPVAESPEAKRIEEEYEIFLEEVQAKDNTTASPFLNTPDAPYNKYSNVFEVAERLSGNHPYGTRGHKTYTEDTLRQAFRVITGQATQFLEDREHYKDAAILLAAIPQSPLSTQTLYRGIQEFEITRSRAGAREGVEFDMPIAKVTTSLTAPLNGALVLKITEPTPWIKVEGTPASYPDEGIVSGRFRVTAVSGNIVTAVQISDYLEQANEVLLTNGWDFGEDISAITASIKPLPLDYDYLKEFNKYFKPTEDIMKLFKYEPFSLTKFMNTCHDPDTGQFCEAYGPDPLGLGIPAKILKVSDFDHVPYEDDPNRLTALMKDIKEKGFTTPIEVSQYKDEPYFVEDGRHRLEAARRLKIKNIPAVVIRSG